MTEITQNRRKESNISHTGTSSLLVIFVIVVLAAFAIGTLILSENNAKMSKRLADNQKVYYNASNNGEYLLAEIDTILEESYNSTTTEADYYTEAEKNLAGLKQNTTDQKDDITMEIASEDHTVSCSIPISTTQSLEITLQIRYPKNTGDTYYRVIRWQSTQTSETDYDDTLQLLIP